MNFSSIHNFKRLNLKKNYLIVCNDNGTMEVFSEVKRILQTTIKWALTGMAGLPGGPVAKTPHSQWRGLGFNPWSGSQILHASTRLKSSCAAARTQCSQIDKLMKDKWNTVHGAGDFERASLPRDTQLTTWPAPARTVCMRPSASLSGWTRYLNRGSRFDHHDS